jgi:hypothetical protein
MGGDLQAACISAAESVAGSRADFQISDYCGLLVAGLRHSSLCRCQCPLDKHVCTRCDSHGVQHIRLAVTLAVTSAQLAHARRRSRCHVSVDTASLTLCRLPGLCLCAHPANRAALRFNRNRAWELRNKII